MLPGIVIAGPTGIGKSSVAVALAERCRGEIVNADPFQIYRGLDLLTAKPTVAERKRVPHHLFDCIEPDSPFDAAQFAALAIPVLESIAARGALPLIVGGSGLYLRALTHGLAPLPGASPLLRIALARLPLPLRAGWLEALDPAASETTNLANPRHVDRALEITLLSGIPASTRRTNWREGTSRLGGFRLQRERADLHARIDRRVVEMVEAGVVAEVAEFARRHPSAPTAGLAIGFREFLAVSRGECPLSDAIEAVSRATRRYAKRQGTWFRREDHLGTICLDEVDDAMTSAARILAARPEHFPSPLP